MLKHQETSKTSKSIVNQVLEKELMVKQADASVSHPHAMMVDAESASLAHLAVLSAWWHNLVTMLAERKLALIRDQVRTSFRIRSSVGCSWLQLKQFDVVRCTESSIGWH